MHKGRLRRAGLWTCMVAVALGLSMTETAQAQAQKIGVVDLQAVLDQSVRGRSAKDRLRDLGDRLQQEIKSKLEFKRQKEEELQKLQTEFRTQKDLLTEQARAAKDEDYRRRARELKRFIDDTNRFTEDATQEFREREIRETQALLLIVRKVVQEIGEREVLVVRPFLHRVIVTLGARDRHAEEGYGDGLGNSEIRARSQTAGHRPDLTAPAA